MVKEIKRKMFHIISQAANLILKQTGYKTKDKN